ncbi:MAG: cellulose-binding domain-containing protein [Actinomycetota bacterium]|uniref:Cellulose-binding domain-containing protein n=1 Tax=Mycobacterium lentiflavum TaxID=141349 RepID=A0ABY3V4D1_MYCLN|nr:cellulose-binding domain-containing protein [Mycobacterium lentiflavum]MEE3063242.1 cellulose-binding domain-containing protein [Actinomycetota bacterium]ULP44404.1 cellulose-binding domain-containing protein [Mycobacterium lentiflavum]
MAGLVRDVKRCRTALHVAVSVSVAAVLALATTPVAHAAAAMATLQVEHTWQTGFIAHFSVTNPNMAPMADWRIDFDMPVGQSVLHAWNSTVTQSGTHFVVTPANWDREIAPGGTATGGFRGALSGTYTPPSNCVVNEQYPCTVG